MLACQHCQTSLNQLGGVEFIFRCRNCDWVNKFRIGFFKEEEKITHDFFADNELIIKQFGGGILYTYPFDRRFINILTVFSQKSGEALENYLLGGKKKLSMQEKNILYKLKAQSILKIEERISYLGAKKKSIEILRLLEY